MLQLTKEFKEFISADLNKSKVCVELGISRNTLLSRLANPGSFRIEEIIKILNISELYTVFEKITLTNEDIQLVEK